MKQNLLSLTRMPIGTIDYGYEELNMMNGIYGDDMVQLSLLGQNGYFGLKTTAINCWATIDCPYGTFPFSFQL